MRSRMLSGRLAGAGADLPAFASSPLTAVGLAIALSALFGIAVAAKPSLVVAAFALVLAILGVGLAITRPAVTFVGLIVLLGLVPSYAAPEVGPFLALPTTLGCWLVAIALMWRNMVARGVLFRPNYVDLVALLFFGLMAVSISFSNQVVLHDYVHLMFAWIGPYFAARLLLAEVDSPVRVVAIGFAIVTAILAPIAVAEYMGASNPFYNLNFNAKEFSIWASQIDRFGSVRAVTSFGHPIAFSMFLAVSALLSLAMGVASHRAKERFLWYALAIVAIGTMALALSRTGWVMLGVGVVLLTAITVRGQIQRRLITLFAVVAGVVVIAGLVMPNELQVVPGFGHSQEANYQSSGLYREKLLERALEPGVLNAWGNPRNEVTPNVQYGTATDNAYIILADSWGLIPTFALFAVAGALLLVVVRSYGESEEPIAILPITAFACLVAIFFVAFITQQPVMIWMLIGAGGASAERIAARRRSRSSPQSPLNARALR